MFEQIENELAAAKCAALIFQMAYHPTHFQPGGPLVQLVSQARTIFRRHPLKSNRAVSSREFLLRTSASLTAIAHNQRPFAASH